MASDSAAGEEAAAAGEDAAVMAVSLALPEERQRIRDLLKSFPETREQKSRNCSAVLVRLGAGPQGEGRDLRDLSWHS